MVPSRIVAFGSSTVQGIGDPEGGGFVGRLRRWHEPSGEGNVTFNLGLAGDSTAKMLGRFDIEVPIRRPELVILYPGLNDIRRKSLTEPTALSIEEFEKNIIALVTSALEVAPVVFVSAFPIDESRSQPWKESKFFYCSEDAAQFTGVGRHVCKSKNAQYLPIFENWSRRSDANGLSLDGLHGTPEAHERLANELREMIISIS